MAKETLACPQCGASNLAESEWCGQCYAELQPGAGVKPVQSVPTPTETGWRCQICQTENTLAADHCRACGAEIYTSFTPPPARLEAADVARASLLPGLGLARAGLPGHGAIVALLVVFSVAAGATFVASGEPLGVLLLLTGVAVWVLSARDAAAAAQHGETAVLLTPRMLTVAAIVALLITAVILLRALPTNTSTP